MIFFIKVFFCLNEHAPYPLNYFLDFGFHLNFSRRKKILEYYWHQTFQGGISIDGSSIEIFGEEKYFPLQINNR
jgi:hypothetical protein